MTPEQTTSASEASLKDSSSSLDNQSHFVMMVKECIDSPSALTVMQSIAKMEKNMSDLMDEMPGENKDEISRIIHNVQKYTLVEMVDNNARTLKLTTSGREFLSILTDIERLKSRYSD